ncbi:MAG: shikimate kinase [Desulfobulbus sp.]
MKKDNIILTGFRATGKTSVGRMVAADLGYRFEDTDHLLCQRWGCSIAEVVDRHGWPFFRRAEAALLRELSGERELVLATGGGAILHQEEWKLLRRGGMVVWLDADPAVIARRIAVDPASSGQRPALDSSPSDEASIVRLLAERRPLYAAGADAQLDTTGDPVERVAAHIHTLYRDWIAATR